MKKFYAFILALGILSTVTTTQAQEVSPVDFMRVNPYQMKANPAADLPYVSVMSLVIGNIGLGVQNNTLRYDNLFEFDAQGRPTVLNLRQFANSFEEKNCFGLNFNVDLFTLYRRLNKGMLTINYGLKEQTDARYSDGLFKLLGYGNGAFVGENNPATIDMSVNAQLYQELAVGYQWNVNENLSLGGRAKLLFGTANIRTDAFSARLFTDANSYALSLEENIAMRAAMPKALYVNEQGELMGNGPFKMAELFRNPGFGVDLAAEYHFNQQFSAVAAVSDLGFIHWDLNNIGLKSQIQDAGQFYDNGNFLFEGMDIEQLQQIASEETYRELFLDTLKQYFQLEFSPLTAYNTPLNTNLLLRGNYDINAYNRFSAQVQGCFYHSGFRPAMTLAYSGCFFEKLDLCATYTVMKDSYDNIGLGILGRLFKTCCIYLSTNNVLGLFKPMNSSAMNVQAGIVFVMRPEDKSDVYD